MMNTLPDTSDRETELLAIRCQLGEPEAFDELVERWHLPLWRYVRRMTGDDGTAEDLLQETWLRILRAFGRLRDPARLRPWLFTIAHRALIDRLRSRYADAIEIAIDDEPSSINETFELGWEESAALHGAIADLPPLERETLSLFYLSELALKEIAEVLEIPVGTVKSRLHRARRLMRDRLQERGVTR